MLLQKISTFSILFIYLIFISNHQILCDDGDDNTGGDNNCCVSEECQEEDCINCGNDYRFFYQNSKCLKCEGISSQKPYYFFNSKQEKCEVKDKKGDSNLLINGTYEIVSSCTNGGGSSLYPNKLGDICYQNQPPNSIINEGEYKCQYFYYKININDFIYFNCLGESITCPPSYKYYDYNSKECLNSCKETANLTKKEENGESYINRCSDNCLSEEFKYQNNCYDNCPKAAKYYYPNTENPENVKECLPRCNNSHFSIGNECFAECNDGLIKVDLKNSIYSCETATSCPNNYPYNFTKGGKTYCLKSCLDTNDSYFYEIEDAVGETTYIYQNSTMDPKLCVSTVPSEDGPFYIDIKSLKWVKDCKTSSSGPFRNTTHCLDACDDDYYFTNDEYECVEDCANAGRTSNSGDSGTEPDSEENKYLYLDFDTKTCYKECPKNLGRGYHNESTNYCQSCNNPKNISDLKPGEGYHLQNNYTCMSSCEENYYHNNNDNICFLTECINSQIYKYQPFDKKICYKSCSDITEGAYKYEANYICYEYSENIIEEFYREGTYYFYNNSGIIKYISSTNEKSQKECLDLNLKYLKDKECVSECNETDYKILPTRDKLGVCLSNISSILPLDDYSGYIYFNKTKIISNKCKFFKILDDSRNAILTLDENCVEKCSGEYQYEYINGTDKICNLTCNFFVYEENGRKKCIDTCDKFKMETSSEKKCVDKCMNSTNNSTYAFYDSDNNCLDSCIRDDAEDQFSFEPIYDHQMCINNCSLNPSYPYYYENEKICLRECRDYYGSDKKCVENCSDGEYVHPGKICTNNPCQSNAPFYYLKNINSDEKVKICVQNCAGNVDNYTYYNITIVTEGEETREEKQCVENCLAPFNLIYESRCYDICPEGLYENNTNCVSKCPYFFKNESGKLICVETCPEESQKYYTTSKECVSECPDGENFIGENNQCLPSCKYDNQKEFYEKIEGKNNYLCLQNCSGKVYIEGTKECIPNCIIDENNELYEYNGTCYRSCIDNPAPYSTIDSNNKKVCSNECDSSQPYFENDKVCINECLNLPFNKIINDSNISDFKFCVRQCDLSSEYKFLNNITTTNPDGGEESYQLYCRQQCGENQRYLESNFKCIEKCPEPYNFVKNDVENAPKACLSACPPEMPYARKKEEKNEYNCSSVPCKEENLYYYLEDKICIDECNDLLINDTICTKTCNIDGFPKLYNYTSESKRKCVLDCKETELNFTSKDGKCVKECEENDYYDENDLICKFRCPNNKKIDGKICRDICNSTDSNNKYEDNGYCVENCSISGSGYIYHKEGEYQCLNYCPDNLYVENYECKVECSNQNPFMNEKNCLSVCPPTKKYYLENNKTCLADCPLNNSYYDDTSFECKHNCLAYIPNSNSKINAKKCLGESCTGDYNYYIKDGNQFICYNLCPQNYPFINGFECLKECPEGKVTKPGEYVCIDWETCNNEELFIKYNSKECVEECGKNDIIYENKYCVDNCTIIQEKILKSTTPKLKLTYDNKCVDYCQDNSVPNDDETLCICTRLFYYDKTTGYKTCLNQDLTSCEREENYPILKVDENECINYCDGILSLSEHECYNDNYTCGKNETLTTLINGDKKCDCIDKFYFVEENERKVKKCLKENDECPSTYSYLIKETKECVESCNDKKIYGKTCVLECPTGTKAKNGNECSCEGKWYVSENYDVICTEECPSFKSIILVKDGETKETGECVSTCIGTGFDTIFNKTCVSDCNGESERTQTSTQNEPLFKNIASNFCKCNGDWYYDINGNDKCIDDCFGGEINFKYKITSTNRCVNLCPENYYIFNDECVLDCGNDKILDTEKKMCICKKFWKYDENESQNSKKKIICLDPSLDSCEEGFLLVNNTNECFKGNECPQEYPIIYNKKCYARNDCPKDLNTYYDEINQKCSCIEKWYKDNFGKIICLPKNEECPGNYKYLNKGTKECQESLNIIEDSNSPLLYVFNYELYSNCPINTKKDEEKKECICDPLLGYWYNNQTSGGKIFKICAQEECPDDKKYNIHKQKECLQSCPAEYKFIYQNICYEKCPNLTEAIGDSNECQIKTVDNEIKLETLEKVMTENIVDLYKKSTNYIQNKSSSDTGPIPGQKIITPNATVEYYGVNKNNKGKSSNNIKSDVSYIDISDCIDKIYSSNKMKEKDDIVILKFDVNKMPNNFLINPVEYKLINSRTGQELDASVCEHNSIKISYPVHDLINKFDKMMRNMRKLEYMRIDLISNNRDSLREKLDKGKEIIVDYPDTDIFNIDSKIYTDICVAVEVDGKDLVLEDRVNYFYPQLSLCENNCTYNHTDFINERIFCDCSYKTEFDFDREYTSYFELNSNQIKNDQSGNSNIAVMKCLSNLKNPKSISKNGGFIYSLLILFIEFILLLIIAIYAIRVLSNKLQSKMKKNEESEKEEKDENENEEKEEVSIMNTNAINKKTDENLKTSERNLNNPPKKKKENFGVEFIPQEYVFLFFNQGDKGVIKKVERDSVPFKTKLNTRILLEQKKNINYDNIKPRGPFHVEQNVLVIVDSMDDDINDYLDLDDDISQEQENNNNKNILKDFKNTFYKTKMSKKSKNSKNINEKGDFKINQKAKLYKRNKFDFSITDYDPSDENYSIYDIDEEEESHEKGLIETMKSNQRLLKRDYDIVVKNKKPSFIEILITEIIDKIYITKILFFTRKFDIFSLQLSVYLLCHLILLVFNTLFFDVKTIKDIWAKESYPGLGYYLGYGFLACLIVWVIYKVFLCLLTNNDKIKEILKLIHFNNKYGMNKEIIIDKKYTNLIWKVKFKFAIYSFIEFLLLILGFLYLTVFCSVYTGTQSKIFKAYGIALIEILIIKILYGIALAVMRHISLSKQKKGLYKVVLFMDTYLV